MSQDSAVEIEIGATASVIELFTTTDGTLTPVLSSQNFANHLPEGLRRSLQDYVGPGNDPLSASWDLLTPTEKVAVLEAGAATRRKKEFFSDRSVPGLIYRPEIQLTFAGTTRFLGRNYGRGTHRFDTKEIFGGTKIEYMGSNRMAKNLGFELHVRSNLPADENFLTSRSLQMALLGQYQNVHQHIVGPYPHATTELGARVAAFRVAEFARRVMLYFDFQMIKRGIPMAQVRNEDGSINFFPANSWEFMAFHDSILARLNDTISGRVSGEETHVISKSGTVGLRTRHFYDGEVLGIEVRYLSAKLPIEETARALARAQDAMTSGRFFLSEQESTGFFHELERRGAHLPKSVQLLHYGSDFNHRLARSSLTPELSELVERAAEKNDFVKMLLHDWKHDPLFYNRPDRLEQIRKAQEHALMLLSHGMKATEVMQIFVKKSGLAHEIEGFFVE